MADYKRVRWRVVVDDARDELRRLSEAPDMDTILKFEALLEETFQQTQQYVHVITGSLRASGRTYRRSDSRRHTWTGGITYGGPAEGMANDPVDYAEYELERGGAHNFMLPTAFADFRWENAIGEFMEGRR